MFKVLRVHYNRAPLEGCFACVHHPNKLNIFMCARARAISKRNNDPLEARKSHCTSVYLCLCTDLYSGVRSHVEVDQTTQQLSWTCTKERACVYVLHQCVYKHPQAPPLKTNSHIHTKTTIWKQQLQSMYTSTHRIAPNEFKATELFMNDIVLMNMFTLGTLYTHRIQCWHIIQYIRIYILCTHNAIIYCQLMRTGWVFDLERPKRYRLWILYLYD